ncbi:MAG: DMT family transporter [Firmicutes bacterium]|nr:DMT family transporter [Bacillota bacterium]
MNRNTTGHILALFTAAIWGTTFISTKVLLQYFQPVEILFFRFVLGFAALVAVCPHVLKGTSLVQEFMFAVAGLCGVCLYYLLENIALTYTMTSNVSVVISAAPFFTAILTKMFIKNEDRLGMNFFIGFIAAITGICLISFSGTQMQVNPLGDILAVAAAAVWACYSVLTKKISSFGFGTIQITRRIFAYGILFMIPALFVFEFHAGFERFRSLTVWGNIVFLGLGASALCFVTWNTALKILGPVKTSVYIYFVPVITIVASFVILKEKITFMSGIGTALTLFGLIISEYKGKNKEKALQKNVVKQ